MDERAKFFFMERVPAEVLPSTVYLFLINFGSIRNFSILKPKKGKKMVTN
jgi:hypothetical protein